ESNTYQTQIFARTLEIVISSLWKKGALKRAARTGVRSVLSNGEGWFKATMVSEKRPMPEVEAALNSAQETHERLIAQQKLELAVEKMFVIDYVESENIQVSTDINRVENYLSADWIGNEVFYVVDD